MVEHHLGESAALRAAKAATRGGPTAVLQAVMVRFHLDEALPRIETTARLILAATEEGDTLRTMLAGLRRFLKIPTVNTVALSRQIAGAAIDAGRYVA